VTINRQGAAIATMARSLALLLGVVAAGVLLVTVTLPSHSSRRELFSQENRYGSLAASPDAKLVLENQSQENLQGSLAASAKGTDHDIGGMLTDKALEDVKNAQGSLLQQPIRMKTGSGKSLAEMDSSMAGFLADLPAGEDDDRNMLGTVAAIKDSNEERNTQGTLSAIDGKDDERNNLGTVSFIDTKDDNRNMMGSLSLSADSDHQNMMGSVDAVTSKLDEWNSNGALLNTDDSKDPVNKDGKRS
jgi:hypothetical protein